MSARYDAIQDLYQSFDMSILSQHLLYDTAGTHQIQEWTFATEPDQIIWGVRDDAIALGFTYMREHDVYAWHRHITDGLFESVASITEPDGYGGYEDAVYFMVNRTIGGQTHRYLEPAVETTRELEACRADEEGVTLDRDSGKRPHQRRQDGKVLARDRPRIEEVARVVELDALRLRLMQRFAREGEAHLGGQRSPRRGSVQGVAPEIAENAGEGTLAADQENGQAGGDVTLRLALRLELPARLGEWIRWDFGGPQRPPGARLRPHQPANSSRNCRR